jgi:hypothetical protein
VLVVPSVEWHSTYSEWLEFISATSMRPIIVSLASRKGNAAFDQNQQSSKQTTSLRPPAQQRIPLQSRDNNAMMRGLQKGAPLSTRSGNAMPPNDKQNGTPRSNTANGNASAIKNINKTPLTPRVAGSNQSLGPNHLARKGTRHDSNAISTSSQAEDFSTPVTPVSTFLNNNITPRSSSRKIRGAESASTTPTHTPTGTSTPDLQRFVNEGAVYGGAGLNFSGLDTGLQKRPAVSFSPALSDVGSQKEQSQPGNDTKFFYASDAKAAIQNPRQQRSAVDSRTPNFFYANGDAIPPPATSGVLRSRSVVESSVTEERKPAKFFHANGTPDSILQSTQSFSGASSMVSSGYAAPKLATRGPTLALSPLQRPKSPSKLSQNISSPQKSHAPNIPSPPLTRAQAVQDMSEAKSTCGGFSRRKSGHERSASASVVESSPSARRLSNAAPIVLSSMFLPASPSHVEAVSTPVETISENGIDDGSSKSDLHSPVRAGHSLDRMNELAANARRERKVLDLEITNSSLAAINRTLEREMRKQTAELRRYRRLSRSGRLSIATSASIRTSAGSLTGRSGVDILPLSDMSEEEREEGGEEEEEEETSEEESVDEGSLSPGARAESDARHRKKDERRLQLDLSKHQQLLIDSQNMNQSLKRCLGWTEELIKEGNKALAYHVHVSDIELGGRVLPPDELDDQDDIVHIPRGVLSQISENTGNASAYNGWQEESKDDGDSGVELEGGRGILSEEEHSNSSVCIP